MTRISKDKPHKGGKYHAMMLALVFVVAFGAIGFYVVFRSNAAAAGSPIKSGYAGNLCMDDYKAGTSVGTKVVIAGCNGSAAQNWQVNTSGNIQINGLCVGFNGNGTVQGTKVILVTCSSSSLQQWNLQSNGRLVDIGASRKCLTAGSSASNTQLDIQSCISGQPASQAWSGGPIPAPAPPPPDTQAPTVPQGLRATKVTTSQITLSWKASTDNVGVKGYRVYRNGGLISTTTAVSLLVTHLANNTKYSFAVHAYDAAGNVSGADTISVRTLSPPSPKPKPSPTPSPPPVSTPVLTITPTPKPAPVLTLPKKSAAPAPTLSVETPPASPASTPMVSDVFATTITSSSIALTWQGSDATDYTIKYGLSAQRLNTVRTLHSAKGSLSFKLTDLPAGRKIYIAVTPSDDGQVGAAVQVSFQTDASHNVLGAISVAVVLVVLIAGVILVARRRRQHMQPVVNTEASSAPAFPREDSDSYASRLLWWLPENERQQTIHQSPAAHHQDRFDDVPDMFEEGCKRLEAEQDKHQHGQE